MLELLVIAFFVPVGLISNVLKPASGKKYMEKESLNRTCRHFAVVYDLVLYHPVWSRPGSVDDPGDLRAVNVPDDLLDSNGCGHASMIMMNLLSA